jgi:hypothetical protein
MDDRILNMEAADVVVIVVFMVRCRGAVVLDGSFR